MNPDRSQSLSAKVLLIGCVFVVVGGFGTWYFGSKPSPEKKLQTDQPLPGETHVTYSATPAPQSTPQAHPGIDLSGTPVLSLPKPKTTPALITSESGSSSPLPAIATSKPGTKWSLDDKQRQQIADILGKHAGKSITICSIESDAAGLAFAGTLKHVFEQAGWHVDAVKQIPYSKPPVGLNLASGSFPPPEGLGAAYQAFDTAGFHVSQQLDSKLTGGQVELIVGSAQ